VEKGDAGKFPLENEARYDLLKADRDKTLFVSSFKPFHNAREQNLGKQRILGGTTVITGNNLEEINTVPLSAGITRTPFQTLEPKEKVDCHAARVTDMYPGEKAVKAKGSIVLMDNSNSNSSNSSSTLKQPTGPERLVTFDVTKKNFLNNLARMERTSVVITELHKKNFFGGINSNQAATVDDLLLNHHNSSYISMPEGSKLGCDNVNPATRVKLDNSVGYLTTGDSVAQIGTPGLRILNAPKFALAQDFAATYADTLLCHRKNAIIFGRSTVDACKSLKEREAKQVRDRKRAEARRLLGRDEEEEEYVCSSPEELGEELGGDMTLTLSPPAAAAAAQSAAAVGAAAGAGTELVPSNTFIRPIKFFRHSTRPDMEQYNNHGLYWNNVNNRTSNTISSTVLENNVRLLNKKQTKSTLNLDSAELNKFIATDQGPVTCSVNHCDLGSHIDHAKLPNPRGAGASERDFVTMNRELCPSPQKSRSNAVDGRKYVVSKWEAYKKYESRADDPLRVGDHGRRHFHAEKLKDRPLAPNVSGIENMPNPAKITNFLNLQQKDENYNISVVRNDTLRNRSFLDLGKNPDYWRPADLSKCDLLTN